MRHSGMALVLLGLVSVAHVDAAGGPSKTAAAPAEGPEKAYMDYLRAVQSGAPRVAERYLTEGALAQLHALPEAGRRLAIQALAAPLPGLEALKVVSQKVTGDRAVLQFEARIHLATEPTTVAGTVELVNTAGGWFVRSETWMVGQPPWSGLRAGLFPPEAVAVEPLRWVTADVRTVISAEAAYQSANQGYYDTPACLGRASGCIPGPAGGGLVFLSADLASLATKDGFRRRFDPGAPAPAGVADASPSSLQSYAYWLIPDTPAVGKTARCGDASGIICDMPGATAPATKGQCPLEKGCVPVH